MGGCSQDARRTKPEVRKCVQMCMVTEPRAMTTWQTGFSALLLADAYDSAVSPGAMGIRGIDNVAIIAQG